LYIVSDIKNKHRTEDKMDTQTTATRIKKATIYDYTSYDSQKCNNGGAYGFWEKFIYIGDGKYERTYHTTADFSYCEYCGQFSNNCSCESPEMVDEEFVLSQIKDADQNSSTEISAEFELFDNKEWIEKVRRRVRDSLNKTTNETEIIRCANILDVNLE
jgi:Pyruvate/2-oxoacid:ferredoxin oxidoreductase delta subunit